MAANTLEQEFFPFIRGQVRPSANGYEARWRQIKPWLAELRLRDTTTPDVQQILASIHKLGTLDHDSIRALRYLMKMIFDHAIRMGLFKHQSRQLLEGAQTQRR